jgi:putative addiction module antidote
MLKAKITTIGNSVGIVLPKEALDHLKVRKGDVLVLSETADGYQLHASAEEFEVAMKAYERTRRRYRNALRELAK